jgi:hypothetical protein
MKATLSILCCAIVTACVLQAQAATPLGGSAELDMRATITCQDGLVLVLQNSYGANGAGAYVYTDVSDSIDEDSEYLGFVPPDYHWPADVNNSSWSAHADTSNGEANGSVTVNTDGFDYLNQADALVEGLSLGDYGYAKSWGFGYADWYQCTHAGTARITIDYTYTLDTEDTCDDGEAWVYMNVFFADWNKDNRLTAEGDWVIGPPNGNGTTCVEYSRSISAGDFAQVISGSVSWDIAIPNTGSPNTYWSFWAYGETGVELSPVPEPATMLLAGLGLLGLMLGRKR